MFCHDFFHLFLRYTAENSVKFGAPRDTDHPELRQPLAQEVWDSVLKSLDSNSKITVLTNGPLTNLAKLITSNKKASSLIQVSVADNLLDKQMNNRHTKFDHLITD